jgi:acetamidase/formamidase
MASRLIFAAKSGDAVTVETLRGGASALERTSMMSGNRSSDWRRIGVRPAVSIHHCRRQARNV